MTLLFELELHVVSKKADHGDQANCQKFSSESRILTLKEPNPRPMRDVADDAQHFPKMENTSCYYHTIFHSERTAKSQKRTSM